MTSDERSSGRTLVAVATVIGAVVSLGFSIASLLRPSLIVPGALPAMVGPFAGYAFTRSLAIVIAVAVALGRKAILPLLTVGWIVAGVQALDAVVGLAQHDPIKTLGPLALAIFSVVALARQRRAATSGETAVGR